MKWRTTTPSYLDHTLHLEGAEVDYTPPEGGQVAENLHPIDDAAQAFIDGQTDAHPCKREKKAGKGAKASGAASTADADDAVA